MPRKLLERTDWLPYHVTARANNRERFPLPLEQLWEITGRECLFLHMIYGVEFHAVVQMPNHYHLLLTVPEHDLGVVMNDFMRSISRAGNFISGRSGHFFGGPYHWTVIKGSRYFGHALKYVYRNPVRAGLCEKVEEYFYSTLRGQVGSAHLPFPLFNTRAGLDYVLPSLNACDQLPWLNTPFPIEAEDLIRKGLSRKVFEELKNRKARSGFRVLNGLI